MKYVGYIMQKGSSNIYYQDQHSQNSEKSYNHQNHTFSNPKYSCKAAHHFGFLAINIPWFGVWTLND